MTTITEDYVSFKVAKLLKEKGFPQEYNIYHSMVYNEEDYEDEYESQRMVLQTRLIKAGTLSSYPIGVPEPKCYCPTLQMTMKWLRLTHKIYIQVFAPLYDMDCAELGVTYNVMITNLANQCLAFDTPLDDIEYNSPEEAYEAAIKYCLENLI